MWLFWPFSQAHEGPRMLRDRNTWNSLTRSQMMELEEQLRRPENHDKPISEIYEEIARLYADRCASMLNDNDLRGALNAAELCAASKVMAKRQIAAEQRAQERIAALKALPEGDPLRGTVIPGPQRNREASRRSYEKNLKPRQAKTGNS